ncbi:MAG: erythronate-4-phosphate dehydrogenase, partial [Alloprevotella sp.]|nr:erythronate-4-phosphate dehydrogenase [Alloprevotella sp.]
MRLIIDSAIPYMRGLAERLGECRYLSAPEMTPSAVRDADALVVRTRTRCDAHLLEGSRVRFVATATAGTDHLDLGYLRRAGIGWAYAPGCNAGSVAQYVECCLLRAAGAGLFAWEDAVVGIVGVGHVGRAVEAALRKYPCRVLRCDPPRAR